MSEADLALLAVWRRNPHVIKFWGSPLDQEELYEAWVLRTAGNDVCQCLIALEDRPVGYFQYYWASRVGDGWWPGLDPHTVGIDFFIGEPDCLGRGLGTAVLRACQNLLFADPAVDRIIGDPCPENDHIRHLLRKTGFREVGLCATPDGEAVLCEVRRPESDGKRLIDLQALCHPSL